MTSIDQLQVILSEFQSIITNTVDPVYTDLANGSNVLDSVINSNNQLQLKIDEMTALLNSGLIQGLKGDTGDQGIQGLSGLGLTGTVSQDGHIKFNDIDLIVKWGKYAGGVNSPTISFPVSFPKNIFIILTQVENVTNTYYTIHIKSKTLTNFIARQTQGTTTSTTAFNWLAIGN